MASDANGNFVVVWSNYNTSYDVYARRFDASGVSLGSEVRVNSVPSDYATFPAVASDASGNAVVAWKRALPAGNVPRWGVFGQRVDASGVLQGGEFQVNSSVPQSQGSARLVSDPTGNFVVVWSGEDGGGSGIFGQRFNASGVPEGGEFQVNTYSTGSQSDPAVASTASGDFVVVWASHGQDGSDGGIFGQRFDASGLAQGGEFRVNSYTPGVQGYPSVASASNGGFVVVWTSSYQDGSYRGLFGQRFDAFGAPRGRGFRVNSYTTGAQMEPAVASDASGNFVVVWTSARQDGSSEGVFGQRFSDLIFKNGFE